MRARDSSTNPSSYFSCAQLLIIQTSKYLWQLFWKRADGKWHRYPPRPETKSLADALAIIHEDPKGCFFG
ncbi:MAG: DUF3024 domain-containing protein [Verrucomicrobiota bacterium]|nr:DUF3024 domain-containing protein [Verrucomicrobiota bacterium]